MLVNRCFAVTGGREPAMSLLYPMPYPLLPHTMAQPTASAGLTILAYRYEGLRKSDLHMIVVQLKRDYSRQAGPRDRRPAAVMFQQFLSLARRGCAEDPGILPLSLFQPNDTKQLVKLYQLTHKLPELVHYLLCQHVFPLTMNFQQLKVSASGHELGSGILFGARVGFSGTPSNLLPMDLGGFQHDAQGNFLGCQYEPGRCVWGRQGVAIKAKCAGWYVCTGLSCWKPIVGIISCKPLGKRIFLGVM